MEACTNLTNWQPCLVFSLNIASIVPSIFCAVAILVVFCCISPFPNSYTIELLKWLTFADLCNLIGNLLGALQYLYQNTEDTTQCTIVSAFTSTATMVSFCLTLVFTFHLYNVQINQDYRWPTPCFNAIYTLFSFSIPRKCIVHTVHTFIILIFNNLFCSMP